MKLLYFNIVVTVAYIVGMVLLVRELRIVSVEERRERQTIPMMMTVTLLYIVLICKTRALVAMFAGG